MRTGEDTGSGDVRRTIADATIRTRGEGMPPRGSRRASGIAPEDPRHEVLRSVVRDVAVSAWHPDMSMTASALVEQRDASSYGRRGKSLSVGNAVIRLTASLPADGVALASNDRRTLDAAVTCDVDRLVGAAERLGLPTPRDDHATAIVTPTVVLLAYHAARGVIPLKATAPADATRTMEALVNTSPDRHVVPMGKIGIGRTDPALLRIRDAMLAAIEVEPLPESAMKTVAHLGVDQPGFRRDPDLLFFFDGAKRASSRLGKAVLRAMAPVGYEWDMTSPFANRRRSVRLVPTALPIRPQPPPSALLRAGARGHAIALLRRIAAQSRSTELLTTLESALARGS